MFERIIYDQLSEYLKSKNLIYDLQSGFRPGFSTDTTLTYLTDYIRKEMDRGSLTGMVMLDLQKAFDTVDHSILLSKLTAIGLDPTSVSWLESYLSDRSQSVDVGGTRSDPKPISCGVPQGSILGPLLFLIYVNDMQASVKCKLLLYTDDSALLVSGENVSEIQKVLSQELKSVCEWLVDNKLSIHLGKTETISFGSSRKLSRTEELKVTCNRVSITPKTSVGYLGAEIDQNVSGEAIASKVLSKVNGRLKFLIRKSKFLDLKTRISVVNAIIQCHFDYACSSWFSGLSASTKSKLQICQNKLIRFVLDLSPRTHIGWEHFQMTGWLPIEYRVHQLKLGHMFKIFNKEAPSYQLENFRLVKEHHAYITRSSVHNFILPGVNSAGRNSFYYTGAKLWNSLPGELMSITTLPHFKQCVKLHLLDKVRQQEMSEFIYF